MRRKLVALDQAFRQCAGFLGELGGDALPPVFKSEQDAHEHAFLGYFLTERAGPFIKFWGDAIDAVDAGASLVIEPGEHPDMAVKLPFRQAGTDLLDSNHRK